MSWVIPGKGEGGGVGGWKGRYAQKGWLLFSTVDNVAIEFKASAKRSNISVRHRVGIACLTV